MFNQGHSPETSLVKWQLIRSYSHKSEASFERYAKRARAVAAEQAFYVAIGEEAPRAE